MNIFNKPANLILDNDWNNWSTLQKEYLIKTQFEKIRKEELNSSFQLHTDYESKIWELGKTRPEYGENCPSCNFSYCFYAEPRNWSMGSDSDVWNLMKCANYSCQTYFESCL